MSTTSRYMDASADIDHPTRETDPLADAPMTFSPTNRKPLPKVFDKAEQDPNGRQ